MSVSLAFSFVWCTCHFLFFGVWLGHFESSIHSLYMYI
jgi:hypothetical protein